ncbi:hypothetical protein Syun_013203 [Stephania yunnanensis]|uniref:ARID domain-containing protein n=1 Tax=Stephania yunnanensis TaxID=152371 RepID=A0AAP0K0W9_9MAGN
MAGWSILTDGCALDYLEILRGLQSKGFCLDFDSASMKACGGGVDVRRDGKLRCLFEQVLFVFLKEVSPCECVRTLPAMLGDGRCVDLFRLFLVVREKGGYGSVSKKGAWGLVGEELGLGEEVAASVKLLYIKYVYVFDRWVWKILRDKGVDGCFGSGNCGGDFGLLPMELATEFRGLLEDIRELNHEIDEEEQQPESSEGKVSEVLGAGIMKEMENGNGMSGGKTCIGDSDDDCVILDEGRMSGGKKCVDDDESCVKLENCVVKEERASGKRKRGSWVRMLDWVIDIALRPGHLRNGRSLDDRELRGLALQARDLLFRGRHVNANADKSLLQKKPRVHPSMYDDDIGIGHRSMERLRCSERIISQKHPSLLSSSESIDVDMSESCVVSDSPAMNVVDKFDDPFRQRVPLGALFQAEVPEWTDGAADDDSKWLGTQDWPLATGKLSSGFDEHSIGKGREDLCDCRHPGSVECIRFHVAERKMKLKLELGRAFYNWGFRYMGEEVSLSWTEDEEKKFKDIVRLHPESLNRCFWDELRKCFPNRCWKSLVRYYFNVFVLRRRSYQNRVNPAGIDSDDDESEFGSVSNGFGCEAIKIPGSTFISCALNNQCIDLD